MEKANAAPAATILTKAEIEAAREATAHRIRVAKGVADVGISMAFIALVGGLAYKVITTPVEVAADATPQS